MSKKKKLIVTGVAVLIGSVIFFAFTLFNDKPEAESKDKSKIEQQVDKKKDKKPSSQDKAKKETTDTPVVAETNTSDNSQAETQANTQATTTTPTTGSTIQATTGTAGTSTKTNTSTTNPAPSKSTGTTGSTSQSVQPAAPAPSAPTQTAPTPTPAPTPAPQPTKVTAPTSIGAIQAKVQSLPSYTPGSKTWTGYNGGLAVDVGGDYNVVGDPLIGIQPVDGEQKIFIDVYSAGSGEKALIRDILAVYYPNSYNSAYNDFLNAGGFKEKTYDGRYFATGAGGSGINRGISILIGY